MARELVQFRKSIEKLYEGKSHLNSIRLQICEQQTNYRVSKAMAVSASAMHTLNAALTVPQIRGLTEQLAREMCVKLCFTRWVLCEMLTFSIGSK